MKPYFFDEMFPNELYNVFPKVLFVPSLDKLIEIKQKAEQDGNRVYETDLVCNCSGHSNNKAIAVTFGYSCVIEYLFIVCERCSLHQSGNDIQLIETLYK